MQAPSATALVVALASGISSSGTAAITHAAAEMKIQPTGVSRRATRKASGSESSGI